MGVHTFSPCRETILNYHKNGTHCVEVAITRFGAIRVIRLLIAREREWVKDALAGWVS